MSSVFVATDLSGDFPDVVCAYLNRRGVHVVKYDFHQGVGQPEEGVLDLAHRAEVFLLIRSSGSRTSDGREERRAWWLHRARVTGRRIVIVDVADQSSLSPADLSVVDENVRADVIVHSTGATEPTLRALSSAILSTPLRLDRDLSILAVTIPDWRELLKGVQEATGAEPTASLDQESYAQVEMEMERRGRIGGDELMEMSKELPVVAHQSIMRRAIIVGLLRNLARREDRDTTAPTDARPLWKLLRTTLDATSEIPSSATLSSQGFHAIPLFSVVRHGRIEELLRLHVWPSRKAADARIDNPSGAAEPADPFSVHSHQPHATSWVLSGGLRNYTYNVREWPSGTPTKPQNIYRVAWDGDSNYSLGHRQSSLRNTRIPVAVATDSEASFQAGHTYTVAAGEYHSTAVLEAPSAPTVTLFYFDATIGWNARAGVIGPASVERSTPHTKSTTAGIPLIESISGSLDLS